VHALLRTALVSLLICGAVQAQSPLQPGIDVHNQSKLAIKNIFAKPNGAAKWGSKIADSEVNAGDHRWIKIPTETNCIYDIRVVYENDQAEEQQKVDICKRATLTFGA